MLDPNVRVGEHLNKVNVDFDIVDDTTILIGPVNSKIDIEYRAFVVNRKMVDVCQTHLCGDLRPSEIANSRKDEIQNFINSVQGLYAPHHNYVIDVALIDSCGKPCWKVIEYGCINCSGFYAIDRRLVFKAMLGK